MRYTIRPDAPGHWDCQFKVFHGGIKVATLSMEQVMEAVLVHEDAANSHPSAVRPPDAENHHPGAESPAERK